MNGEPPIIEIAPGLYQIGDSASPSSPGHADAFTYFLTRDAPSPPVLPTLDHTWEDLSLIGWYIFLAEEIPIGGAQEFVVKGRASLPSLADNPNQPNPRVVIWLANITSFAGPSMLIYNPGSSSPPIDRIVNDDANFSFGLFGLKIPAGANIAFSGGSLQITADWAPLISYNNIAQNYQPYGANTNGWVFNLDFTGPLSGSFVLTQMALYHGQLEQNFGCNLRYFYTDGGSPASLAYAFTPPTPPQDQTYLGLNFYLDPIHPTDSSRTRIELDVGTQYPPYQTNSAALRAPYFSTTAGGTITLRPVKPASPSSSLPPGWAFCAMPPSSSSPTEQALYLAPVGTYAVDQIEGPGSPGSPANSASWMPGLFAQEFLELAQDDQVELVSGQPAFAPSFISAAAGAQPAALDPTYTTSWVRFPLTTSENPPGYFGQPSASVYYGARESDPFPRALSAQLSSLDGPMLFPIGPYAGIFANGGTGQNAPFAAFEATILSGVRHAQAPLLPGGPRFHAPGAVQSRFSRALVAPDPVGWGTTPQGFLAGLDNDGGWVSLTLACSPQDPTQTIGFDGAGSPNGRINPLLASALLEGQLFLVVSDPKNLGQFNNAVALGEFNFTLDVGGDGESGAGLGTVLVFKVQHLANPPGSRGASGTLVQQGQFHRPEPE